MKTANQHSGTSQNCWMCLSSKPLADFNPSQIERRICRACNNERVRQWTKNNPTKRKAIKDRYRKTPEGRAAYNNQSARWKKNNTANAREYKRYHCLNLTENYLRQILHIRGIKNPTKEQIEAKRIFVQTLRARRAISMLIYGSKI